MQPLGHIQARSQNPQSRGESDYEMRGHETTLACAITNKAYILKSI